MPSWAATAFWLLYIHTEYSTYSGVQIYFPTFNSLDYKHRRRTAESYGNSVFTFLGDNIEWSAIGKKWRCLFMDKLFRGPDY